ncbi:MAG: putative caspase-like protein [Myxococcota bacterium]|jgi:uncharacterized caspase-like protein
MSLLPLLLPAALAGVGPGDAELDAVYAPRRVAVLIGIQDYTDPDLQGLQFAAKDASDLGGVLSDPSAGGFDIVHVISRQDETTAGAIRHAIATATAGLQRDDTFLLYVSGHGTLTVDPLSGSALYLLPSDGDLDRPAQTGVAVSWLEEVVNALPARRRVLILDTCHNGRAGSRSAMSASTSRMLSSMRGEPPAPAVGVAVSDNEARLFAAEYYQAAYEDPALENGVYTNFLIAALTAERDSADLDRDGLVDVVEAHDFAMDRTFQHTGGAQMPRAEYRITGREKIYLSGDPSTRSGAEQALLSAYDQLLSSARLFVDGVPRGGAVGAHPVEPGRHSIELRSDSGQLLVRERVHLSVGTTTPLEDLFERAAPRWVASAGAVVRHGPASDYFHPVLGEVELSRVQVLGGPSWLHREVHGRAASMYGTVVEDAVTDVFGGEVALGGSVGLRAGALAVGGQLELGLPWRMYTDARGVQTESALTPMPGARVLWTQPLGAIEAVVRYDARWSPYVYDGAWTHLWHHGIAVGVSRR